jgi:hypothetical protein
LLTAVLFLLWIFRSQYDAIAARGLSNGFTTATFRNTTFNAATTFNGENETFQHVMASPRSVGLPISALGSGDPFHSERDAVKINLITQSLRELQSTRKRGRALHEHVTRGKRNVRQLQSSSSIDLDYYYAEDFAKAYSGKVGDDWPGIPLVPVTMKNPIKQGINAGKNRLSVSAICIAGSLSVVGEIDAYRVQLTAGDIVTFDLVSSVDNRANPMYGGIRVSFENPVTGALQRIVNGGQDYESFDPIVLDRRINQTGTYVIEVFPQENFCLPGCLNVPSRVLVCCRRYTQLNANATGFNLTTTGLDTNFWWQGDYDLLIYGIVGAVDESM